MTFSEALSICRGVLYLGTLQFLGQRVMQLDKALPMFLLLKVATTKMV